MARVRHPSPPVEFSADKADMETGSFVVRQVIGAAAMILGPQAISRSIYSPLL